MTRIHNTIHPKKRVDVCMLRLEFFAWNPKAHQLFKWMVGDFQPFPIEDLVHLPTERNIKKLLCRVTSGKLSWAMENSNHLKMFSLLKMWIFHCHVSLLEGTRWFSPNSEYLIFQVKKKQLDILPSWTRLGRKHLRVHAINSTAKTSISDPVEWDLPL